MKNYAHGPSRGVYGAMTMEDQGKALRATVHSCKTSFRELIRENPTVKISQMSSKQKKKDLNIS